MIKTKAYDCRIRCHVVTSSGVEGEAHNTTPPILQDYEHLILLHKQLQSQNVLFTDKTKILYHENNCNQYIPT